MVAGATSARARTRLAAAALEWRDVTDASDGDGLLVAVRRSKTNPDGEAAINGAADALVTFNRQDFAGARPASRCCRPRGP